jgi:hypothetical protein
MLSQGPEDATRLGEVSDDLTANMDLYSSSQTAANKAR